MLRECSMEDISDGRTYELNDMVKCDTGNCQGCHKCCTGMGTSIILDPFDIWRLKNGLSLGFEEMLNREFIELNMVDGMILPNLKMNEKNACAFLDENGRCSIHNERPGICRLFPLGRVYQDEGFKYFIQKGQCINEGKLAKIKVKKWIDTDNIAQNQVFVLKWHSFIRHIGDKMIKLRDSGKGDMLNEIAMYILNEFFVKNFSPDEKTNTEGLNGDVNDDKIFVYDTILNKIDEAYKNIDKLAG